MIDDLPPHSIPIDERIDDLLPGRSLLVKQFDVDEYAMRVSFEVRPPIETPRREPERTTWLLHGRDDLGHEYLDGGGAFGLSPDGTFTEGVESLQPPPPAEASYVDLEFLRPDDIEVPRHVIRVRLPQH